MMYFLESRLDYLLTGSLPLIKLFEEVQAVLLVACPRL
jgi:hypothetical protein